MRSWPGDKRTRRNAFAAVLSAALHLGLIYLFVQDFTKPYALIEPAAPPLEVEIVPPEQITPPIIPPIVYHVTPPQKTVPPKAQPLPQPPKPPTPVPSPAPAPQVRETLTRPNVVTAAKAPTAKVAPAAQVNVKAASLPQTLAPPAQPGPLILNLHKPAQAAPAGIASLPMAPPAGGASPPAGAPSPGGGRNGLSSLPYGAMPSGGSGLRGSLVGCANSEAIHLSAAEKSRCNDRFGENASAAPKLDPISAAKRSELDKQAEKQERDRKYRDATPIGTTQGTRYGYGQ